MYRISAMQGSEQQRQRQGSWSPHKKSPNWQRQTWYIHSDTVLIEGSAAGSLSSNREKCSGQHRKCHIPLNNYTSDLLDRIKVQVKKKARK